MKQAKLYQLILIAGLFTSIFLLPACKDAVLGEEKGTSNEELFDLLWNDLDQHYSYFTVKDVNWDEVYATYEPLARQSRTSEELFSVMADMLDKLRDIHVNLYVDQNRFYSYTTSETYPRYPENFYFSNIQNHYVESLRNTGPYFDGSVKGHDIGYLRIVTFGAPESQYTKVTTILSRYKSAKGLIIDLRDNGGGNDAMSRFVAGLFTNQSFPYSQIRFKNGPGHEDFRDWETRYIEPSGETVFTPPVVLLTNRACFSSTEDFILAMRQLPRVTMVGDTTGGGAGNPVVRELPNGWTYRYSRWQYALLDRTYIEETGIAPNETIWISPAQANFGRDPILERAIQILEEQ